MNETPARRAFNAGIMNQLAPCNVPIKELVIPQALDRLVKTVAGVEEQVSSFLQRLAPICRPEVENTKDGGPSPGCSVPLANPIHAACDSLDRTMNRLNAVRDTLEL